MSTWNAGAELIAERFPLFQIHPEIHRDAQSYGNAPHLAPST